MDGIFDILRFAYANDQERVVMDVENHTGNKEHENVNLMRQNLLA